MIQNPILMFVAIVVLVIASFASIALSMAAASEYLETGDRFDLLLSAMFVFSTVMFVQSFVGIL